MVKEARKKLLYTKHFYFNIFLDYNFDLYLASLQCNVLALKKGDHSNCIFFFFFSHFPSQDSKERIDHPHIY